MRLSAALLVLILAPAAATACSICATAAVEQALPPAIPWSIIGAIWFLVLSTARTIFGCYVPFVPKLVGGLALAVATGLAAAAMLGVLAPLLLAFLAALGTVATFLPRRVVEGTPSIGRRERIIVGIVGSAALLALVPTGIVWTARQNARTPVDIILRWNGTTVGRGVESSLSRQGAAALPAWRDLLVRAEGMETATAAGKIAELGDPAVDVPLLVDALARVRAKSNTKWEAERLEESLAKLSGIETPKNTSVDEWRRLWSEKQ